MAARTSAFTVACIAACLPILAVAVPAPEDISGPPSYSINGCPANVEWTTRTVADTLGISERVVRRAKRRMGLDAIALCTMHYASVEVLARQLNQPKARFQFPDEAMKYRELALRSDDGTIAADGMHKAIVQRQLLQEKGGKLGGLKPGTPFWTEIGPFNVGGRVRAILPLSPTRLLVGGASGGLFYSENAGASWSPVRDLMPNVAISCLVADPIDNSSIYVCTGEIRRGDGIYRITGANLPPAYWTIARLPGTSPASNVAWYQVNRLAVLPNPADPGNAKNRIIVAAPAEGIWRSSDGGINFTRVAGTQPGRAGNHYQDLRAHPMDALNLVAGEAGGLGDGLGEVAFSVDGGLSWSRRSLGRGRVEVTPVAGQAGVWLALVENPYPDSSGRAPGSRLHRSVDRGATWTRRDVSGLDNSTPAGSTDGGQGSYDLTVWSSPDGARVMAGGISIRLSIDGGQTFGAHPCGPGQYFRSCPVYNAGIQGIHVDHHAIVAATDYALSGIVYFGNDGGVYKANVAAQTSNLPGTLDYDQSNVFTSLNNNLGITQFYGGAGVSSGSTIKVIGGSQDNGVHTWNGTTWKSIYGGDGGKSAVDPAFPHVVYSEIQNGLLLRLVEDGNPQGEGVLPICEGIRDVPCNNGVTQGKVNFIAPFILDPNNSDRMYFGAESLWRTGNVRTSYTGNWSPGLNQPAWTAIKGPQVSNLCRFDNNCSPGYQYSRINAIAVARGSPDIVWVGYNDGQLAMTTNGTSATPTWTNVEYPGLVSLPRRIVLRITIDLSNSQRVWVTFGGYNAGNVVVTTNGGASWKDVHGNLPESPVRDLVRHPIISNLIYVGTEVGVFTSDSGGTVWSAQNDGPGTVSVDDLFFLDSSTLVAVTHGRGMFKAVIDPTFASPVSLEFGGQSINTNSPSQSVTVTNARNVALTVPSMTVSTYFSVTHNCATVAAGGTCTANVTFTPTTHGSLTGTLAVATTAGTMNVSLSGTGEKSLVTHYYRSILRRAPDSGGKSYWDAEATRVQALGVNVNEVWFAMAGAFYSSAEYLALNRDNSGYVTDLFSTFFNRAPDAAGLAYWKGQLDQGLPRELALAAFMFSAEFASFTQAIFGSTTTRKEVDTVVDFYRGLLGALPDDGGFKYWLGLFQAAQCKGAAAVNAQVEAISSAFANSTQYIDRKRTNAQYVGDIYNAFLRRGGDLAGVQFWISQITTGAQTREAVRKQFVASTEFSARVNAIIAQGCLPQ